MSIILGLLTKDCALVASDGRVSGGGRELFGITIDKSKPVSDSFDKTFILNEGKIIGAYCGTTQFNGKTIEGHIEEIVQRECKGYVSFEEALQCIRLNIKKRLEKISENEVGFQHRTISLILISTETGNLSDLKMYTTRFFPNHSNSEIEIESNIIPGQAKNEELVYWQLFGDDNSQKELKPFLISKINDMPIRNEKTLRSLCYKAIRFGIKHSKKHPFGDDLSCGGNPFVKSIK